jgi:putative Holliday junction resolvase
VTRLLGVDLGDRRVGLAVGDTTTLTARALATIRRGSADRDVETLGRIIAEQRIDALVVGLPLLPGGAEGAQAVATRAWAEAVGPRLGRPLTFRDERGTSLAAEADLGPAARGHSGAAPSAASRHHRRARIDREAARLIVQAEMDAGMGAVP